MLINAQRAEQVRVAIVDGTELKDYQVQISDKNLCRGNIYRGIVANVQPSLGAAFIDIGEDRHGFLSVADVVDAAYHKPPPKDVRRPRVDQVLERGKPILVQATKDGSGMKGPALSTNVALAGRYLVLTPFDPVRGISRKAEDDTSRKTIRERLGKLNLPDGHGAIVRTNGLEQNQQTLNRDLSALLRMWKRVRDESRKGRGPRLLYSDQDLIVQALRDYLDSSIAEVVVDDDDAYEKASTYMQAFMPRSKTGLTRYSERLPLFSRYGLEPQIDRIYERRAPLPSGGSIVIDSTEALTAIDVNSGRATHRGDHDESILEVNKEAAHEVARQLRLRDIGGLVVVDFIDMRTRKHQAKLEKVMRDAMKVDKARYTVGKISPNGLLEINRQRIRQALHQRTHRPCPLCHGAASIPTAEFAATTLLGKVEARVAPGMIERATVAVHPEIADALQNIYRARLTALEQELDLKIEVISATNFSRTEERIDYHQREAAVAPRIAALSSSDLAASAPKSKKKVAKAEQVDSKKDVSRTGAPVESAGAEPPAEEKAAKRPARKRRRRRKSAAKKPAETAAAKRQAEGSQRAAKSGSAGGVEEAPAEAADEAKPDGKPSRSRRRRRGGRRSRKAGGNGAGDEAPATSAPASSAPAPDEAASSEAASGLVVDAVVGDGSDLFDSATDWNAGLAAAPPSAGPGGEPVPAEEAAPRRRRRAPRKSAAADAQPPADAWQSPLVTQPPAAGPPPARRSPLRRDRSTLRWQWWGGGTDDAEPAAGGEPPAGAGDSEDR